MGTLIGLIGLAAFAVGIVAGIKGSWPQARIRSRAQGWVVAVLGFLVMAIGGALSGPSDAPPSKQETRPAAATRQPARNADLQAEKPPAPEPEKPVPKTFAYSAEELFSTWREPEAAAKEFPGIGDYKLTSWQRSDLSDGTPRWWNQEKDVFMYEVIGSPNVQSVSLFSAIVSDNAAHNAEIIIRMGAMMQVVDPATAKAERSFLVKQLTNLLENEDPKTWETAGASWELQLAKPFILLIARPK